jgi:hypothetical protein
MHFLLSAVVRLYINFTCEQRFESSSRRLFWRFSRSFEDFSSSLLDSENDVVEEVWEVEGAAMFLCPFFLFLAFSFPALSPLSRH